MFQITKVFYDFVRALCILIPLPSIIWSFDE